MKNKYFYKYTRNYGEQHKQDVVRMEGPFTDREEAEKARQERKNNVNFTVLSEVFQNNSIINGIIAMSKPEHKALPKTRGDV